MFDIIDRGDPCSTLLVIAVLIAVGSRISRDQKPREWGVRIAGIVFAILFLDGMLRFGAESWMAMILRALCGGGVVLGLSWILLPPVAAVLRLLIVRPLWAFRQAVGRTGRALRSIVTGAQTRRQNERRQREWERTAPERERRQMEQQQAKRKSEDDQHRREGIRLACQLLYDQHAHALRERFPRERLVDYFQRYLSDGFTIDIVEQRGKLLIDMIESSLEQAGGQKLKFSSLNEIAAYFQQQKDEIASLNHDEPTRQSFLALLNHQEDRTVREFLST